MTTKGKFKYEYQGCKGLKAIAEKTGIPTGTLTSRIQYFGMSISEAVQFEGTKKIIFTYKGIHGAKSIAEAFNVDVVQLRYLVIVKGYDIKQAIKILRVISKKLTISDWMIWKNVEGIRAPSIPPLWALALGVSDEAK